MYTEVKAIKKWKKNKKSLDFFAKANIHTSENVYLF